MELTEKADKKFKWSAIPEFCGKWLAPAAATDCARVADYADSTDRQGNLADWPVRITAELAVCDREGKPVDGRHFPIPLG